MNTIMQTAFFAISGILLDLTIAEDQALHRENLRKARGSCREKKNFEAVDATIANLQTQGKVPAEITSKTMCSVSVPNEAPKFVREVS